MFPDAVAGMYGPGIWRAPDDGPPLGADEREFVERRDRWITEEGAYAAMQSTRPQTLAYGLIDSPVGLAGWMMVTGTIGSSFLPYFERDSAPLGRISVPPRSPSFPTICPVRHAPG
jgi:hypothetical protein